MKDPVQSSTGYYFERTTIELWLKTRGQFCPISGEALTLDDLQEKPDLRNEIKRYHIQQVTQHHHSAGDMNDDEDDLYDF